MAPYNMRFMKEPFLEMLQTRRSIRQFTGAPIPPSDLETISQVAVQAPSAVNVQPWAFVAVTRPETLEALADALPYAGMVRQAGAAVIVCGLPGKDPKWSPKYWIYDCSAAAQNVLLAAHGLGYGAVWCAVHPEEDRVARVRAICGMPDHVVPMALIPIGVPAPDQSGHKAERSCDIHWEQW